MTSKIQNSLLSDCYGNPKWVSSISSLNLEIICEKLCISKFMEHMQVRWHDSDINQWLHWQRTNHSCHKVLSHAIQCMLHVSKWQEIKLLITALDTFDLGASIDHEKFMNTLSVSNHEQHIPFWNILFQWHTTNMTYHNNIFLFSVHLTSDLGRMANLRTRRQAR